MVIQLLPMLAINACPDGGYVVRGGFYNAARDSHDGIAFAGTLEECLDYIRRKLTPTEGGCTCGKF